MMIIRLTLGDNDHTDKLERFANNLFNKLFWDSRLKMDYDKLKEQYSRDAILDMFREERKIQDILNPNITESLTTEQKGVLKSATILCWNSFVDSLDIEISTKEYLKKNFKVSFSFSFKDKWENGEVVYYFTTAQKWLSQ